MVWELAASHTTYSLRSSHARLLTPQRGEHMLISGWLYLGDPLWNSLPQLFSLLLQAFIHSFIHSGFTQMSLCLDNVMVRPFFTSHIRIAVSAPIPFFFFFTALTATFLSILPLELKSPFKHGLFYSLSPVLRKKCLPCRRHSVSAEFAVWKDNKALSIFISFLLHFTSSTTNNHLLDRALPFKSINKRNVY